MVRSSFKANMKVVDEAEIRKMKMQAIQGIQNYVIHESTRYNETHPHSFLSAPLARPDPPRPALFSLPAANQSPLVSAARAEMLLGCAQAAAGGPHAKVGDDVCACPMCAGEPLRREGERRRIRRCSAATSYCTVECKIRQGDM